MQSKHKQTTLKNKHGTDPHPWNIGFSEETLKSIGPHGVVQDISLA